MHNSLNGAGTSAEEMALEIARYRGLSRAWKLLCNRLTAPSARLSLLAEPLLASSTGKPAEIWNKDRLIIRIRL